MTNCFIQAGVLLYISGISTWQVRRTPPFALVPNARWREGMLTRIGKPNRFPIRSTKTLSLSHGGEVSNSPGTIFKHLLKTIFLICWRHNRNRSSKQICVDPCKSACPVKCETYFTGVSEWILVWWNFQKNRQKEQFNLSWSKIATSFKMEYMEQDSLKSQFVTIKREI